MPANVSKKASRWGRLFFCLLFLVVDGLPAVSLAACPPDRIDQSATVSFVADGDTVRLDSGQWVRLIGINTPERGRDGRIDEPLAAAARGRLQALLAGQAMQISLRYGSQLRDRHGRLLAHAFLPDGSNLGEVLLREGLGFHIVVPPNEWALDCYRAAEQRARRANQGVWGQAWFAAKDSRSLADRPAGFMRVRGRVVRIARSRQASWIHLEGRVALKIDDKDQRTFADLDLQGLVGRTVTVRGWFYPSSGRHADLLTRLRHPAALELN